jgi:hypothetical protein
VHTEWRPITEFPNYSVSTAGIVRNEDTGYTMAMLRNQNGIVHVGLTKGKKQYKRSVPLLVAEAFLVPPRHSTFDTPINLDGDRMNNSVENLLWRPRWFATRYFRQFNEPPKPKLAVVELNTGTEFQDTWDAAILYGLVDDDIRVATQTGLEIWPTYQRFRVLHE